MLPFNIFSQEKAEAPTYKDVDSWQFRLNQGTFLTQTTRAQSGDYEVTYSENKLEIRSHGEDVKGAADVRRMINVNDQGQYLQFPLFVGK